MVDFLLKEYFALHAENLSLQAQLAEVTEERDSLKKHNQRLDQEVRAVLAAPYTAKSERAKQKLSNQQLEFPETAVMLPADDLDDSEEDHAEPAAPSAPPPPKPRKRRPARKKKKSFKDLLDSLPVDQVITLDHEPRACDICGSAMDVLKYDERRELVVKPAEVYVRVLRTPVLVCRNCDRNGTVVPIIHQKAGPLRTLPRVQAAPETLAWLHYEKAVQGVPFYRLENMLQDFGVSLSRTTLNNWMIASSERCLSPLARCIERELLKQPVIHHDETPFQVLKEPGRSPQSKGYVWIMASPFRDVDVHYVRLYYNPSRAASVPLEHLADYQGWLVTDGYSGYRRLADQAAGIKLSGCWAHARREWYKAFTSAKPKPDDPIAVGFGFMQRIFQLEEAFAPCSPEERLRLRQEQLKPLLAQLHAWLEQQYTGETMLGKAVQYTLNRWPQLEQILQDGRLAITNAAAEIVAKHFAVCRKNSLFADGIRGADALMDSMTVLLTARANGLRPYDYLTWVFREMPIQLHALETIINAAVRAAIEPLKQSVWQSAPPGLPAHAQPADSVPLSSDQAADELVRTALDACSLNLAYQFLPEFAPDYCRSSRSTPAIPL